MPAALLSAPDWSRAASGPLPARRQVRRRR
jgi:hypothetical protein